MNIPGYILMVITVFGGKIRSSFSVYWNITTSPVVFGKDLELTCHRGLHFTPCSKCTWRWYGGKSLDLLSFNNITLKSMKYGVRDEPDKFDLIIKNFNIKDMNIPYTCSYGFDSYKRNLTLETDFEMHPTNETFTVTDRIDKNGYLHIQLQFEEVHPLPTCSASLNEKPMVPIQTKALFKDLFFNLTLYLQYNLEMNNCTSTFNISCSIGTYTIHVLRSATFECNRWKKHKRVKLDHVEYYSEEQSDSTVITLVLCGVIFVGIVTIFGVVLCRRKNSKKKSNNKEEDVIVPKKGYNKEIEIKVGRDMNPSQSLNALDKSKAYNINIDDECAKMCIENKDIA